MGPYSTPQIQAKHCSLSPSQFGFIAPNEEENLRLMGLPGHLGLDRASFKFDKFLMDQNHNVLGYFDYFYDYLTSDSLSSISNIRNRPFIDDPQDPAEKLAEHRKRKKRRSRR